MTNILASIIFIIFVLSTASQSSLSTSVYKNVEPSVVIVQANDSQNEPLAQGTGFFIDKTGDIITNFHIINGSNKINVTTVDGYTYKVKNILAKDISSDLACLSVDIPSQLVYPIKMSTTLPDIGEDILVIGYPEGPGELTQSMTRGIVSSIKTLNEYGEVIQIDAAVSPGASGSPLVNINSEAVGVTTFGYIKGQKQNFAVSYKQVSKLIHGISSAQGGKQISEWNLTPEENFYAIGIDLYRGGKYDEAVKAYDNAIELDPKQANLWNGKGIVLDNLGKYDEAVKAYDNAIELDPNYTNPWNGKGIVLDKLGKHDEAIKAYDKAIGLAPKVNENDNRNVVRGVDLANQGMYEQALDAFNRQINLVPGESDRWNIVWAWKAVALYKLGRYEEAREAIVHELQLNQFKENTVDSLINQIGLLGKSNQILSDADVQDFTNQMENNSNSPDTQAPDQTSDSCCVAFLQNHVQLPNCSYEVLNKCAQDAGLI